MQRLSTVALVIGVAAAGPAAAQFGTNQRPRPQATATPDPRIAELARRIGQFKAAACPQLGGPVSLFNPNLLGLDDAKLSKAFDAAQAEVKRDGTPQPSSGVKTVAQLMAERRSGASDEDKIRRLGAMLSALDIAIARLGKITPAGEANRLKIQKIVLDVSQVLNTPGLSMRGLSFGYPNDLEYRWGDCRQIFVVQILRANQEAARAEVRSARTEYDLLGVNARYSLDDKAVTSRAAEFPVLAELNAKRTLLQAQAADKQRAQAIATAMAPTAGGGPSAYDIVQAVRHAYVTSSETYSLSGDFVVINGPLKGVHFANEYSADQVSCQAAKVDTNINNLAGGKKGPPLLRDGFRCRYRFGDKRVQTGAESNTTIYTTALADALMGGGLRGEPHDNTVMRTDTFLRQPNGRWISYSWLGKVVHELALSDAREEARAEDAARPQ
ncbi:hypothetical protein [Sphingobium yanoikuyae]|uniref:hypothetical protein n=1 Tax=Sphingobium yanoikuyae TaxID=13690 RepID=UPI00031D59A8|nr:hypothetical protein [Sphingobium yanoikuyae]